ncbi:MAG: Gfo/Idh/MocA family oxidoreductase [Armatimonas sp.]
MSQTVSTAVIGYGFAGRCFHSYLIGLTPGLHLTGIASRDPETRAKIQRDRNCHAYASFEEVLEDPNVELVVLATPNAVHSAQAIQALDAGKNVVTDKIMCLSLKECDAMLEAAERNGKFLSVFQNRRWDGDYLTVRSLLDSGELGDLRFAELAWQGFGAWGGWRGQAEMGGGRFFDLGAHLVDQLLLLFSKPVERVYAVIRRDYEGSDIDSEALIVVSFEGGGTGVCDLSGTSAISKPRWRVQGTKGTFIKYGLDPQEKAMIAGEIDSAVEPEETYGRLHDGQTERVIPTLSGRWRNYYESVADTLLNGTPPSVPLAHSRAAMAVIDAALDSARTGQAINL